jgi:hypothetical protein
MYVYEHVKESLCFMLLRHWYHEGGTEMIILGIKLE